MVGIYHCIFGPTRYYTILVLINPLIYYFLGHGEQFNGITAFVDASNVYASNLDDNAKLMNAGGEVAGGASTTTGCMQQQHHN